MRTFAILRDEVFSPNSVDADREILSLTAQRVGEALHTKVDLVEEKHLACDDFMADEMDNQPTLWLSMARSNKVLRFLREREEHGQWVVNSAHAVEACRRSVVNRLMGDNGIPVPPSSGTYGCWLKRGDIAAQTIDDVVFAENEEAVKNGLEAFRKRGIQDVVVSAHIPGDLIKFYGVADTGFFKVYYPTADGGSKFGHEKRNGKPHYYTFDRDNLMRMAEKTAMLTRTWVYGGDAIVDSDGRFYIIDFNDWPSFSRCKSEAADAIKTLVLRQLDKNITK